MLIRPLPNHIYTPPGVSYTAGDRPNNTWSEDEYGPHTAMTDQAAIACLDRLVTGPVDSWETLESAELLLRALILHEMSYVLLPAVMIISEGTTVYPNRGSITEDMGSVTSFRPYNPEAISDTLKTSHCLNYNVYSSWVYIKDGKPIDGDKFWIDNFHVLQDGTNTEKTSKFDEYIKTTGFKADYISTPGAIGSTSYFGDNLIALSETEAILQHKPALEKKILDGIDDAWADQLTKLGDVGLGIVIGPFISIVLSRAKNRSDIPSVIAEIRDEMNDARNQLRTYSQELQSEKSLNKMFKKAAKLDDAVNSVIPAAFPKSERPLRLGWEAAKVAWDVWAENNAAAGVKFLIDTALKRDANNQNVSRFNSTKVIADELRKVDRFDYCLRKHLSNAELNNLGIS